MKAETAAYFNNLARELREDPRALEKQFNADLQRIVGPKPIEPMDADDGAQLQESSP